MEQLYQVGAVKVYVAGLYEEEWRIAQNGGPYADTLIVDLPADSQKRRDLFRISNEESEKEGFEPETDGGQNELWFWWD
ncbi:MAG: hypothetical protein HC875_16490 [Anaerolineales bacterium]|nr:hypothetical protein [Anaerolineales bacterium]